MRSRPADKARIGRPGPVRLNDGFVLVSVLWVLAILTVMALGFGRRAMMERKVAWYALDHAQALQMARGAAERAIAELGNKRQIDLAQKKDGYTGLDQRWAQRGNLLDDDTFYAAASDPDFEDDFCGYRIYDCASRISVNGVHEDVLHEVEGLPMTAVRMIVSRRRGGERGQDYPRLLSLDELRGIRGIDDEDWYGRAPGEGLRDVLTVWGSQINLNTASERVLRSIPDVRSGVIDRILDFRRGPDGEFGTNDDKSIRSWDDFGDKMELSADRVAPLRRFCTLHSGLFRIEAVATRRRGKIVARVTAIVQSGGGRSVLQWSEDVFRA